MTDERKNEIWAWLTPVEQAKIIEIYNNVELMDWDRGYHAALEYIFGFGNLTAPADETTPKSPSHGGNGQKLQSSEPETTPKSPSGQSSLNPLDVVESVKIRTKEDAYDKSDGKSTDWNAYRLDLAREIAVAMVADPEQHYCDIAKDATDIANEIVKRLKETEECIVTFGLRTRRTSTSFA